MAALERLDGGQRRCRERERERERKREGERENMKGGKWGKWARV